LLKIADIVALMNQARGSIREPLRAATYETLIGLLAASGLRIGEAIKLDRGDIDWTDGVLLVRESKFNICRLRHMPNYVAPRTMLRCSVCGALLTEGGAGRFDIVRAGQRSSRNASSGSGGR
jgi:integrase